MPLSAVIILASSSAWARHSWLSFCSKFPLSLAGVAAHFLKLFDALWMAVSASSDVESGTLPITLSFTGFVTLNVFPVDAEIHFPAT